MNNINSKGMNTGFSPSETEEYQPVGTGEKVFPSFSKQNYYLRYKK